MQGDFIIFYNLRQEFYNKPKKKNIQFQLRKKAQYRW